MCKSNMSKLEATLYNLHILFLYLSRNMKCFIFFLITWSLVASFPLDKQAQVNTISSYLSTSVHLFFFKKLFLFPIYDYYFFLYQDEDRGKDKEAG